MSLIRRGRPRYAVGYIRVSTHKQALLGNGLEAQSQRISTYASENGYKLMSIYEDEASGNDKTTLKDRPGFATAAQAAKISKAVIIVASLSRVSRNAKKYHEFREYENVRIVSAKPGETDDAGVTLSAFVKAGKDRESIVNGTKKSLAAKKAEGKVLGNVDSLPAASRASWKSRATASHMKVLEIRDVLLKHPELQTASVREVADQLNLSGIKSSRGLRWNKESLRRMLQKAKDELALLNEPDEEDDDWSIAS